MKVAMKKKTFDALTLFAIIIALSLLGSLAGIAWYRMTLMTDAALKKEHVNESIIWLETLKTGLNHLHGEQSDSVTADQESRDATDLGAIERKLAEVEKLSDDGVGRRSGIQRLQQFIRSTILTPQPWPRQTIPDGEPTGTSHRTSLLSQAIALVDNNIGAEQNFLLQLKQADQRQKLNTRIALLSSRRR